MGGTVEKVGGGMGGPSAGGAQVVRGPANPLQVGVEGRREPGPQLGEGGSDGSGRDCSSSAMGGAASCRTRLGGREEMVVETAVVWRDWMVDL